MILSIRDYGSHDFRSRVIFHVPSTFVCVLSCLGCLRTFWSFLLNGCLFGIRVTVCYWGECRLQLIYPMHTFGQCFKEINFLESIVKETCEKYVYSQPCCMSTPKHTEVSHFDITLFLLCEIAGWARAGDLNLAQRRA